MLASVIMAVHNGGRYLQESIGSILGQTLKDFEFIIVNDGSQDNTKSLLERYEQDDRRIQVYHQEHSGLVSSLNKGCRLAKGKYLVRMDADDIAFPERLHLQIRFLEHNPQIALVGGAYVLIDEAGVETTTLYKPVRQREIKAMMSRGQNPFLHSTVAMRKKAFESLDGYRSAFVHAEDYDLWLRFSERYKVANLLDPLVYYRVHGGQVSHQNLEQGIISVLGSQAAAFIRARTGHDPTRDVKKITPELLSDLGVSDAGIQNALSEAYFWQANLVLLSGKDKMARELFSQAVMRSHSGPLRKKVAHWASQAYARTYERPETVLRRLPLELFLALNACCTSWGLGKRLIWSKVCRLLQSLHRFERTFFSGT